MNKLTLMLSRLPILWKLTLYSSLLLCLLFVGYNTIQYFVIKHWITSQTEAAIQKSMGELQVYYQEKKPPRWMSGIFRRAEALLKKIKPEQPDDPHSGQQRRACAYSFQWAASGLGSAALQV